MNNGESRDIIIPQFDNIAWNKKKTELYLEQGEEALLIKCQTWFHHWSWSHLWCYQQVWPWIWSFYEHWTKNLLSKNPNAQSVKKISMVKWMTTRILEEWNEAYFWKHLPDLLLEFDNSELVFLEVKAFAPWHWPVIYEDQFVGYNKYAELWIPTYYVFIWHSAKSPQGRFNHSWTSKKELYKELNTPRNIVIISSSDIETLYNEVPASRINDKRKNRMFKRLRENQINIAFEQHKDNLPQNINSLCEQIRESCIKVL